LMNISLSQEKVKDVLEGSGLPQMLLQQSEEDPPQVRVFAALVFANVSTYRQLTPDEEGAIARVWADDAAQSEAIEALQVETAFGASDLSFVVKSTNNKEVLLLALWVIAYLDVDQEPETDWQPLAPILISAATRFREADSGSGDEAAAGAETAAQIAHAATGNLGFLSHLAKRRRTSRAERRVL